MINSCIEHPNPNGSNLDVESEILVMRSGLVPIPVNEIGLDLPFNGFGPDNADIGVDLNGDPLGCTFQEPTVTALPGCDNVIPLGPGDMIPPNAVVVAFITGTTVTADVLDTDFSNLCEAGVPIYVLQNACERTAGAFANGPPGSGNPLRTITVVSFCGLRGFTYNTQEIDPADGTYYIVGLNEVGNLNCDFPVLPQTCPPLDTTLSICNQGPTVDPPFDLDLARQLYPNNILSISFHNSAVEAEGNSNALSSYAGPTNASDTLYARLIYQENLCITVGRLVINFPDEANVATPPSMPAVACDPSFTGFGTFNLRTLDDEIGGGAPVTYFTDSGATNEISDPTAYSGSDQSVFARAGLGTCQGNIVEVPLAFDRGPTANTQVSPTSCPDVDDGEILVTPAGNGPFDYDWPGETFDGQDERTGLAAGSYNLTVTNANGCALPVAVSVPAADSVSISCTTVRGASGPMAADGAVSITIAEGNPPFIVSYSGADAGAVTTSSRTVLIDNLLPGDYSFSVEDTNGCNSASCTTTVLFVEPIDLRCFVLNNSNGTTVLGALRIQIDDGAEPFTVVLSDQNGNTSTFPNLDRGTHTFPNLPVGQYTITVTDFFGQTEQCSRNIILDACPLNILETQLLTSDCTGSDNVIIRLTIGGNEGAIMTQWGGGNGIEIFNGQQEAGPLPPGSYFVAVSDMSGCPPEMAGPITVSNPGLPTYDVAGDFMTSPCQSDGFIIVTPSGGGTPPFRAFLHDANTDAELAMSPNRDEGESFTFTGLSGGDGTANYYVYITDQLGCALDTTFIPIVSSPAPSLTLPPADQTIVPVTCTGGNDGSITVSASGGTAPYDYRWIEFPPAASIPADVGVATLTDLIAGTYGVEITDASGCMDTARVDLPDGGQPSLVCGNTVDAFAGMLGSVAVTTSDGLGPYRIEVTVNASTEVFSGIQAGQDTLRNLPEGLYQAVAIDANGCRSTACSFTINAVGCDLAVSLDTLPITCATTGRIVAGITGGQAPYTLRWSDPALPDDRDTVFPVTPGLYAVSVEDALGCMVDTSIQVNEIDDRPRLLNTPSSLPTCGQDSLEIPLRFSGQAPFVLQYYLEYPSGIRDTFPLDFFTNTDTLRIAPGDVADTAATVTLFQLFDARCQFPLAVNFPLDLSREDTILRTETYCGVDSVEIAGRFFTPTFPSDTFFVDDGSLCGQRFLVDLTFNAGNRPDTSVVFTCPGSTYTENGEEFDANRPEGLVRYPRPGDCDSVVYVRLDFPPEALGEFSTGACAGDTIFYGDRFFTDEVSSGLAVLPGQAANGCDSLVFVNVNFRRTGEVRLFGDFEICPGDSIDLRFTYDGPGSVNAVLRDGFGRTQNLNGLRNGSRVTLFPDASTSYQLIDAGIGGCPAGFAGSSSVVVNDLSGEVEVLTDPGDFCVDTLGRARVTLSGGVEPYTFAWSNDRDVPTNLNLLPGTYAVTATDADGCTYIDSVMLRGRTPLIARFAPLAPDCIGGLGGLEVDTIFGGNGFYEMSVDGSFFLPVEQIADFQLEPGIVDIMVQDATDCSAEVRVFIPPAIRPEFNLPADTTILLGDSLVLDPNISVGVDTFWWSPDIGVGSVGGQATSIRPLQSTVYTLTLITEPGCTFVQTVDVTVDERTPVYGPTAFSPNGDGMNEIYQLGLGPAVESLLTFQIYNRWGVMVYQGTEGWDGMLNGQRAPSAVYVYQAEVLLTDGSTRYVKGDFVLMR
ncbi:gliding motility-associated C-terminal domain-containing protein [Lewinella sp. W8]|uniref:T9SS type B sorting domain-containing protein n=1 Tax=Lewinella sp. W8 TaxID=2528208 RepID=UPI001C12A68B|nr:gliding motility-associated C-terminal domain-containing protein [Lewinella sp. W8]